MRLPKRWQEKKIPNIKSKETLNLNQEGKLWKTSLPEDNNENIQMKNKNVTNEQGEKSVIRAHPFLTVNKVMCFASL